MRIRNFCIIAHIDHGKSTLADRLLEATGTVSKREMREQVMDAMELERERGITIKAKAVRMEYRASDEETYTLNLIDTPGHVDFTYEVSRALAACEGALLVVDASQGVEAQTLANARLAQEAGLVLLPVINKIDLPQADPGGTAAQIREVLGLPREPLRISAKEGSGISEVLEAIVRDIPSPSVDRQAPLAALVFDSVFDPFRGVVVYLRVLSGELRAGMRLRFMSSNGEMTAEEVGVLRLKYVKTQTLSAGEVGYLVTGLKELYGVRVGDTLTAVERPIAAPHPGYKAFKPFVFAGLYPMNNSDYDHLTQALKKLHLTDSSFVYQPETSRALGFGFRAGFLGLLHLDIIKERIQREFHIPLLVTAPNVVYKVRAKKGEWFDIENPDAFPPPGEVLDVQEPYISATLITPTEAVGPLMQLCQDHRGLFHNMRYLSPTRVMLLYDLPLAEVITDFYDQLKSLSRGYASFDYEHAGYSSADLVKLEILVNQEPVDAFCTIVHQEKASHQARKLTEVLRDLIPRQLFEIPIQARVGSRIIARESVRALRKDVLAKCYGGDITRKRKLLEKQKEGKKRMKQFGQVEIPPEAFMAVLSLRGTESGGVKD